MSGLAKRIQSLQQRIVANQSSLNELSSQEDLDIGAIDTLSKAIETDRSTLAALERAEAQLGAASTSTALVVAPPPPPAHVEPSLQQQVQRYIPTTPQIPEISQLSPNGRSFAIPGQKVRPSDYMIKAVTVAIKHFADPKRPVLDVLKETYGDNDHGNTVRRVMAEMVTKAAAIPADTTTSGWATNLVQTVIGDFIESLIPYALYPRIAARGRSYTFGRNGTISLPARNTGTAIAGAFIAQGAPIPVKQGAFTSVTMTPKKMGVITTLTREITEHSIPSIEQIVRDAILEDTGVAIDTILLDATAADTIRPAGLKNGISKVSASATASIVGFVADIGGLTSALITATSGRLRAPAWIMNPADVLKASLLQTTVGETPFREEMSAGTLLGFPIFSTTTGLSDMFALIDCADFATATGDTPQFSVSDQAVLHMEDTSPAALSTVATPNTVAAPIRSLWQTDTMAIRMILDINWIKRRSGIFQWTDTMAWN